MNHTIEGDRMTVVAAISSESRHLTPMEAAAPAMLEALKELVFVATMEHARTCAARVCDCDLDDTLDHSVRAARAAIALATGTAE